MLLAPLLVGCVHEYHPEDHPEMHVSYVQNIVTVAAVAPTAPPAKPNPSSELFVQTARDPGTAFVERSSDIAQSPPHVGAPGKRATRRTQYAPVFVADDSPHHGE